MFWGLCVAAKGNGSGSGQTAQAVTAIHDTTFITTHSLALYQCDAAGTPAAITSIPMGVKFKKTTTQIPTSNTYNYVITFLPWKENHRIIKPNVKAANAMKNRLYVYDKAPKTPKYFLLEHDKAAGNVEIEEIIDQKPKAAKPSPKTVVKKPDKKIPESETSK